MKITRPFLFLLVISVSSASEITITRQVESSLSTRAGFDSHPTGTNGTIAAVPGGEDTLTFGVGANFGFSLSAAIPAKPALKLTYAGEVVRFDGCPSENFISHRFGLSGQFIAGAWKFSGEGSSLFVDGSSTTVITDSSMNANAISLWRERRRQWQHRLKLQTQADFDTYVVRASGTLLVYDYHTQVVPGKIAFADRSDAQGSVDLGRIQNPNSLWLGGFRVGRQNQATVPLPNCAFDYSNDYTRLAAGWEGKPCANTTVTFAAGPDFRHYTGAIDPRVFLGGRNRTSLWFEGGFVAKLSPTLTLTGKAGQMDWLSSTGKSAYVDSGAETAAAWGLTPDWTLRFSAKVHRCEYFPAVRDDWESLLGIGGTLKLSKNSLLTIDILRHQARNLIATFSGREFHRLVVSLGASIKL